MSDAVRYALIVVEALAFGVGLPWLAMRLAMPAIISRSKRPRTNYRGQPVVLGLGLVWVFWAIGLIGPLLAPLLRWPNDFMLDGPLVVFVIASLLGLAAAGLGLLDDLWGSAENRGFRGHLRALSRGRITTGLVKLVGISFASLVAVSVYQQISMPIGGPRPSAWLGVLQILVAGAAIALTSNLLNLTDLRPGRALKSYSVLALVGVVVLVWPPIDTYGLGADTTQVGALMVGVWLSIYAAGPVLAAWRYDLSEIAMLGDAGANAAGAVAGFLIVVTLPLWGAALYAVLVLALNLASERWSFSRVIEKNRLLSYLDGLGRLPDGAIASQESAKRSPQSETSDG